MSSTGRIIRDFIYLDVERLYSLYSQVFEGVPNEIVKSEAAEERNIDVQKGGVLSGTSAEAQVVEVSMRTQRTFLFDYMYTLLENRISGAIFTAHGLRVDNYRESLADTFLVKAQGSAEFHDYERLRVLTDQFNKLGEALSALQLRSGNPDLVVKLLESQIRTTPDQEQKSTLQRLIKWIKNPKEHAKAQGLYYDEQFLQGLKLLIDVFYRQGLDIVFIPRDQEDVVFRAPLDQMRLRLTSDYLRALHGGRADIGLTVVGEVTYLPDLNVTDPSAIQPSFDSVAENSSVNTTGEEELALRDAFKGMFEAMTNMERMFFQSKGRVEVILRPLAIYQERSIPFTSIADEHGSSYPDSDITRFGSGDSLGR
jgi:hypothetical protein